MREVGRAILCLRSRDKHARCAKLYIKTPQNRVGLFCGAWGRLWIRAKVGHNLLHFTREAEVVKLWPRAVVPVRPVGWPPGRGFAQGRFVGTWFWSEVAPGASG
jgi:hypothetical protein